MFMKERLFSNMLNIEDVLLKNSKFALFLQNTAFDYYLLLARKFLIFPYSFILGRIA